jgi:two-component system response regulator GlrR
MADPEEPSSPSPESPKAQRRPRAVAGAAAGGSSGPAILVVDDEDSSRRLAKAILEGAGYRVTLASSGEEGLASAETHSYAAIISDLNMPGMDGSDLLRSLSLKVPGTPVIILTAFGSIESAVDLMRHGAYDYLRKPFQAEDLVFRVEKAVEKFGLENELRSLRETVARQEGGREIVGTSPGIRQTLSQIDMVAPSDYPVLIQGESGTGKELAARAIHARSSRSKKKFVTLNCGAIPEALFESELFGHVRGAFTGAVSERRGLFEESDGGTLFLDEIGDLTAPSQVKLLRVLQDGEVRRLGDNRALKVDARLICATHRDLKDLVGRGAFREDLFYRISVFPVLIPALRDRKEDIVLLADRFLVRAAKETCKAFTGFTQPAIERLVAYPWPGNVRELENKIRQAAILAREGAIGPEALMLEEGAFGAEEASFKEAKSRFERGYVIRLLRKNQGNVAAAAREAGQYRAEFYDLMKKHSINPEEYR